jgi:hypothetical protein
MLRGTGVAGTASITGGTSQWNDGSNSAPSIAFASAPTTGLFKDSGGYIGFAVSGTYCAMLQSTNGWIVRSDGFFSWASGGTPTTADTQIGRGSAGVIKFASANSFSANGSVATSMTSLGPTGSHTTIQEWLTIQNASGTVRYIPCY